MRILHVAPVSPGNVAAGPSNSVPVLAAAQVRAGHDVALLNSIPTRQQFCTDNSRFKYLGAPSGKHLNPMAVSSYWPEMITAQFGVPDVVNFHSVYSPFQCGLAKCCRQHRWPYVITPRGGMTVLAQKHNELKKIIANFTFFNSYVAHAAAIHALCEREAQQIRENFRTQKVYVAPNGLEETILEKTATLSAADFPGRSADLLGYVGRIDVYHKGLDTLLQALAILKSQFTPEKCPRLAVVGPYYSRRDEKLFTSLIHENSLTDDVLLLGPKYNDEKYRCYLAFDLFLHPSRFEGMPQSVIEAMALGIPCLVTPGSNMAEYVARAGGWVAQATPADLAENIKQALLDGERLRQAGQQHCSLFRSEFLLSKVTDRILENYKEII